jgi:hypothetical protein
MQKNVLFLLGAFFLHSCDQAKPQVQNQPANSIELNGIWENEQGCILEFTHKHKELYLVKFKDGHGNLIFNQRLNTHKTGIIVYFNSQNLSGTYVEGILMVESGCHNPLHKVD